MSSKGLSFLTFYNCMESNTATYVWCGLAAFILLNVVSYVMNTSSKKDPPPKRGEQNGGVFATTEPSAVAFNPENVKSDRSVNGVAGCDKLKPGGDQGDSVQLRLSAVKGCDANGSTREGGSEDVDGGVGLVERLAMQEPGWKDEGPHVVHLLESGWTEDDLDLLQRPIEVFTWFAQGQSCGCSFELAAILQDKKRKRIAEYQHCPVSCNPTVNTYKKVSLIFKNYGAGVRYVTYSHRRRKNTEEECRGLCVTEMYSGLRKLPKINNLN